MFRVKLDLNTESLIDFQTLVLKKKNTSHEVSFEIKPNL